MHPETTKEKIYGIIPAGGIGSRMGLPYPKQLFAFQGKTLIRHTLNRFQGQLDDMVVPVPAEYMTEFEKEIGHCAHLIEGGSTRFQSVQRAFERLKGASANSLVVIHDAARPFFDPATLPESLDLARTHGAVIYAARVTDTVKRSENRLLIDSTLDRDHIFLAQTPQIFRFDLLQECYAKWNKMAGKPDAVPNADPTDEAGLVETFGHRVALYHSSPDNRKITLKEDLALVQAKETRVGHGYDVHRFDPNRPLILCGLEIPGGPGLLGHSDADVALHALMDAILGALGLGDIGQHFPDTDPELRGVQSTFLLDRVCQLLKDKGARLINIDLTILAQTPKLGPHRQKMLESLSTSLKLELDRINLKFTTTEGLGFVGAKQGMAAHCVVMVAR